MYSLGMPVWMSWVAGTGLCGSLMNSSKPAPVGAAATRASSAPNHSVLARAGGGQAGKARQRLVPVSNMLASARSGVATPLRWCSKNGSSIFCW